MSRLKYPVAVWYNKDDATYRGFPLYVDTPVGKDPVYPLISELTWDYKGTLPAGMPLSNPHPHGESGLRGQLGGVLVVVPTWGVTE